MWGLWRLTPPAVASDRGGNAGVEQRGKNAVPGALSGPFPFRPEHLSSFCREPGASSLPGVSMVTFFQNLQLHLSSLI